MAEAKHGCYTHSNVLCHHTLPALHHLHIQQKTAVLSHTYIVLTKYVSTECQHDMRPSIQLHNVSGVDSKLGHSTSSDYTIYVSFSSPPAILTSELTNGHASYSALGNIRANFSIHVCFWVRNTHGTHRQTDRRTGVMNNAAHTTATQRCHKLTYRKQARINRNCPDIIRYNMQIMTGIEVNSEEYCPSAEGMRAIFPQLREIRLTIDRWWQSLFVLLYLWSKWRRN